jgi:hypothetical protein
VYRRSLLLALAFVGWARPAEAYRPFDGTDGGVAGLGELELEVGTLGYLRARDGSTYFGPSQVINFGPVRRVELVLEGRPLVPAFQATGPRFALVDTTASVKGVLREGVLQDRAGPSIALELNALLPTFHAEAGAGASAALIVSERVAFSMLHLNLELQRSRAEHADVIADLIAEGPALFAHTRPVAELSFEHEFSVAGTWAALLGFIAQVSESFAPDAAVRFAVSGPSRLLEIRGGFTWDIALVPGS